MMAALFAQRTNAGRLIIAIDLNPANSRLSMVGEGKKRVTRTDRETPMVLGRFALFTDH
jgi:hypothetical protein